MQNWGKYIIVFGIVVVIIGVVVYFLGDKFNWLGKLPGDIRIERDNMKFYMSITTMIIISIILTIIINLIKKLF